MKFLFLLLLIGCSVSEVNELGLRAHPRPIESKLTEKQLAQLIPCRPVFLSRGPVIERGYAGNLITEYGDFRFERTDVGSPDGQLHVFYRKDLLCQIELSLNTRIFLLSSQRTLLIEGYSGSAKSLKLFDLNAQCMPLGWFEVGAKHYDYTLNRPVCTKNDQS